MTTIFRRVGVGLLRAALVVLAIPFGLTVRLGRLLGVLGGWGGALMLWQRWDMPGQAGPALVVLATALGVLVLVAVAEAGWDRLCEAAGA